MDELSKPKLVDAVLSSLAVNAKGWPSNVELYTVLEEQELLTDKAKCYAIEALLNIHELNGKYTKKRRQNAFYMPPKKGNLPFLRVKNKVVCEDDITTFLKANSCSLNNDLDAADNLILKGIISIIDNKLMPLELYYLWYNEENQIDTFKRFGYNQPKPLQKVLCLERYFEIKNYLKVLGLLDKTESKIKEDLKITMTYFSQRLEKSTFLVGNQLTEGDVLLYGHLQAILESKLPNNVLLQTLEKFPKLTNFCLNFGQVYLGKQAMLWEFV